MMVGKPKSCTACRQAKAACDARRRAPGICSRCSERSLTCRFDSSFRRIPTRQIAQDVVRELHNIRASQNGTEVTSPLSDGTLRECLSDIETTFLPHGDNMSGTFSLGNLSISSDAAIELLEYFGRHYWMHAPFVEPVNSPSRLAAESPLLFWTLILIASRKHSNHGYLYARDVFPLQELFAPLASKAIRSVEDIHALLCLCLWPIPQRRELDDPSWDYVGLAVNACVRMRLHTAHSQLQPSVGPADQQAAVAHVSPRSRCMTWLACFCISTQVANFLGFMPPLSSQYYLKSVRRAAEDLAFQGTPDYCAKIAVYEVMCNYNVSLEDVEEPAAKLTLSQTFDRALTTIRASYDAHWTTELDVTFQFARLNLYATVAVAQHTHDNQVGSIHRIIQQEAMIYRGLEAASSLIVSMQSIRAGLLQDPKHYFANLFFAAVFLYRMIIDDPTIDQEHKSRAMQLITDAQNTYLSLSEYPEALRVARLIDRILCLAPQQPSGRTMAGYVIDDRLGASMLWDTLSRIAPRLQTMLENGASLQSGTPNNPMTTLQSPLPEMTSLDASFPAEAAFLALPMAQDLCDLDPVDFSTFPSIAELEQLQ
ncbi:hypothetical protein BDV96DRAFT_356667 [Lophiotrema nucula]|uniref:Zn(2)-C6 fungal-type domain-containing protein n=1 Tax=Lophiotrema nucula TaxID=690887 RepID=A0A6A5YHX0_9PLEO|nr:hypothetical protein BDV96DRAFT_356667 [Lophiotrema nucula]